MWLSGRIQPGSIRELSSKLHTMFDASTGLGWSRHNPLSPERTLNTAIKKLNARRTTLDLRYITDTSGDTTTILKNSLYAVRARGLPENIQVLKIRIDNIDEARLVLESIKELGNQNRVSKSLVLELSCTRDLQEEINRHPLCSTSQAVGSSNPQSLTSKLKFNIENTSPAISRLASAQALLKPLIATPQSIFKFIDSLSRDLFEVLAALEDDNTTTTSSTPTPTSPTSPSTTSPSTPPPTTTATESAPAAATDQVTPVSEEITNGIYKPDTAKDLENYFQDQDLQDRVTTLDLTRFQAPDGSCNFKTLLSNVEAKKDQVPPSTLTTILLNIDEQGEKACISLYEAFRRIYPNATYNNGSQDISDAHIDICHPSETDDVLFRMYYDELTNSLYEPIYPNTIEASDDPDDSSVLDDDDPISKSPSDSEIADARADATAEAEAAEQPAPAAATPTATQEEITLTDLTTDKTVRSIIPWLGGLRQDLTPEQVKILDLIVTDIAGAVVDGVSESRQGARIDIGELNSLGISITAIPSPADEQTTYSHIIIKKESDQEALIRLFVNGDRGIYEALPLTQLTFRFTAPPTADSTATESAPAAAEPAQQQATVAAPAPEPQVTLTERAQIALLAQAKRTEALLQWMTSLRSSTTSNSRIGKMTRTFLMPVIFYLGAIIQEQRDIDQESKRIS